MTMIQLSMLPIQVSIIAVLLFLSQYTHHALGVHVDGVCYGSATLVCPSPSAFQYYKPNSSILSPSRSSLTKLKYSSDEDESGGSGIMSWLQQPTTQEKLLLSDEVLHSADSIEDDVIDTNKWDCIDRDDDNNNGDGDYNRATTSVIDDEWTNNSKERRNRRIQSLENFNNNIDNNDNSQQHDIDRSGEGRKLRETVISNTLLGLPYNDLSQLQAIQSNAPAILLPSGPGTGKSHVLSQRIAYLLQGHVKRKQRDRCGTVVYPNDNNECTPDSMVILSFTNRDAERLKDRALDYLFPQSVSSSNPADSAMIQIERNETSRQLWAGTMHAFSLAILNKYGQPSTTSSSPLRVLPAREMRNRVSTSLQSLLNTPDNSEGGEKANPKQLRRIQSRHLQALDDVGQSRSNLYQNIVRCIELWKEANIPLVPPESIHTTWSEGDSRSAEKESLQREVRVRKACLELAMRLGIPKSSALLALDIFGDYQARHAAAGSADPSDLASMAYRLLVDQPKTLNLLRSKLKHIIVDEYQDMSVSQHSLLRLVVRGIVNEDEGTIPRALRKKRKVEQRRRRKLPVLLEPSDHHKRRFKASSPRSSIHSKSLSVPNIFCAGDASQSIYGWRGGAPELTVNGFRRDYPQGVIAPLMTCYRLPHDIVKAAAMLLPRDRGDDIWDDSEVSDSYDISPAAASKLVSSLTTDSPDLTVDRRKRNHFQQTIHSGKVILSSEEHVRLGNRLLLSKAMKKIDSTVILHGLWDAREEAKYIASTIRRRSKDRRVALLSALSEIDTDVLPPEKEFLDSTEVAIMARTSSKLYLVKEALTNAGIPFVTHESKEADTLTAQNWLSKKRSGPVKTLSIKPVTVATMHRSKGEEFDDVYLAGWTEGEFPHPDAVSSNRVHEERRLAYVALTRARQRVVITHSFMTRVLHYGKNGMKKYVTSQVKPSRFLYELVPSKRREDGIDDCATSGDDEVPWLPDNKGTEWKRTPGVKEYVVGRNVPQFFQKAYQMPKGYVAERSELRQVSSVRMAQTTKAMDAQQLPSAMSKRDEQLVSQKSPLELVHDGLKDIVVLRKKGASKKFRPLFKEMLASFFQIRRGNALVFAQGVKSKQTQNGSVYALVEASSDDLVKKPLAKCTATQLGHYFGLLWSKREGTTTLERSAKHGETPWADLTIKELKPELRKRGLKLSGRKCDLVKRLEDYDDAA